MDGKLHSDAHRGDEDDHRNGTQLDSHQPHETKELHGHKRQNQHLREKPRDSVGRSLHEKSQESGVYCLTFLVSYIISNKKIFVVITHSKLVFKR